MASNPTSANTSASAAAASDGEQSPPTPRSRLLINPIFPHCPNLRALKSLARTLPRAAGPTRRPGRALIPKVPRSCEQCGEHFRSQWALFGHMRLHRGRQRRGLEPPAAGHLPAIPPDLGSWSGEAPMGEDATGVEVVEDAIPVVPAVSSLSATPSTESDGVKEELEALDVWMGAAAAKAAVSSPPKARGCGFDLNLPPPEETHGDGPSSSASPGVGMDQAAC